MGAEHDAVGYDDDYDITWADPKIREDYEAALGRLILVHNSVDLLLTELIQCCLKRLGDPAPLQRLQNGSFAQRLENIAMLQALPIDLELGGTDVEAIRELNRLRNVVAHGHFEQNPFDGDYELISNKRRHGEFSTDRLNEITKLLRAQQDHLSVLTSFYDPPDE